MTVSTLAAAEPETLEIATFSVGENLIGVDIRQVQEINRNMNVASVPLVPSKVRGVINLRGEVVTVIDLRTVLGLESIEVTRDARNIVLSSGGERIGLLVDSISDVVTAHSTDIVDAPGNLSGVDGRFFRGVLKLDGELLLVLDVEEVLA